MLNINIYTETLSLLWTKKRNRLGTKKACDLAFISTNLGHLARQGKKKRKGGLKGQKRKRESITFASSSSAAASAQPATASVDADQGSSSEEPLVIELVVVVHCH